MFTTVVVLKKKEQRMVMNVAVLRRKRETTGHLMTSAKRQRLKKETVRECPEVSLNGNDVSKKLRLLLL